VKNKSFNRAFFFFQKKLLFKHSHAIKEKEDDDVIVYENNIPDTRVTTRSETNRFLTMFIMCTTTDKQ
jgi:hypothetical protein